MATLRGAYEVFFPLSVAPVPHSHILDLICGPNLPDAKYWERDNFGFIGYKNGHQLFLGGGTPFDFFGDGGYAPGSVFGGGATLFLDPADVWINGAPMEFGFPETMSFIFGSSVTLPTNGRDFTVPWQIGFSATGVSFATGQTIQLGGKGSGKRSLYFNPVTNLYYPGSFVQTPEPGTLGFLGTGILGILASARKRLKTPGA